MFRKGRISNDVCGDCGATDPIWASINRGILLCGECCSIHRTLGRHVSQIKSMYQSLWCPTLKQMFYAMIDHNVNGIMEHLLLDPNVKTTRVRKPQPCDHLHPNKAEFIRAKHLQLAYILRSSQDNSLDDDLSKQLHASVRSPNLETSVRLLIQGADPNYLHEDKKTMPLHAAVRAGQLNQVELLIIYGANPIALDGQGNTPHDVAVSLGHKQIEQRLTECSYEVTDRLLYFLCKKKPDHAKGQHYIGTEKLNKVLPSEYGSKSARGRLHMLPNHLFEELVQDLYDEIDRREIEGIWQSTYSQLSEFNNKLSGVPFLPVDYTLSTTRNQGRQKLARFSHTEFCALVFDVLMDIKRRHQDELMSDRENLFPNVSKASQLSDDEPIYDSVASDDESTAFSTLHKSQKQTSASLPASPTHRQQIPNDETELDNLNILNQEELYHKKNLAEKLADAENKIMELNSLVEHLTTENSQLKQRGSSLSTESILNTNNSNHLLNSSNGNKVNSTNIGTSISSTLNLNNFVMSGDGLNLNLNSLMDGINMVNFNLNNTNVTSLSSTNDHSNEKISKPNVNMHLIDIIAENEKNDVTSSCILEECENNNSFDQRVGKGVQRPKSMYETREGMKLCSTKNAMYNYGQNNIANQRDGRNQVTCSMYQCKSNNLIDKENTANDNLLTVYPLSEEVMRRTDQVTKRIQELWICIQGDKREGFIPCAERIRIAVAELSAIFPQVISEETVRLSLRNLNNNTNLLQEKCSSLLRLINENLQTGLWDNYLHEVRYLAYEIAKATKQIVTFFQQEDIQ